MHNQTAPLSTLAQVRSFNRSARLFLVATVMDGIVYSGWSLFFNFYILERGFGREFLGLVNAMPSIAALLLGLPIGMLADRIGRKRAMVIGVAISLAAMMVEVTTPHRAVILAAAFVNGAAGMLYFLSHAPFMMKVSSKENRTLLFSLNFGLVTLAGAVGNAFAGQLPALFGVWLGVTATSASAYQAVLLASAMLSIFTLVPLALIREPGIRRKAGPERRVPLREVVLRPLTLKLSLPNLLIGTGAAVLIPYMNVFFKERFAISDQSLGLLFSVSALLTGAGSLLAPRLAGLLGGKIKAVVITQGFSLLFLMMMGFVPFLWPAVIGFLMRGTLMNMAVPLYSAFAMEQVPEGEQATVNSVKELAWQSGWSVGPYASGVVQAGYGFGPLFAATGVLYAAAIGLAWVFFGERRGPLAEAALSEASVLIEPGD